MIGGAAESTGAPRSIKNESSTIGPFIAPIGFALVCSLVED